MRRSRADWGSTPDTSGWGTGFLDFDLDSWPDIFIVNGHVYPEADRIGGHYSYEQRKLLYRNLGNGRFEDVSERGGPGMLVKKASRGAAVGDLFNTGRQDIVVNNMHGAPTLLHNCAPLPRATASSCSSSGTRSNRSAHRRARHGPRGGAPADRRGAQRRQLLLAERSADPLRPRRTQTRADRVEVDMAQRRRGYRRRRRRGSARRHSGRHGDRQAATADPAAAAACK